MCLIAIHKGQFLPVASPSAAGVRLGDFAEKGVDAYADDVFTAPASLTGLPALSVPCGQDSAGLPVGVQLIGE